MLANDVRLIVPASGLSPVGKGAVGDGRREGKNSFCSPHAVAIRSWIAAFGENAATLEPAANIKEISTAETATLIKTDDLVFE